MTKNGDRRVRRVIVIMEKAQKPTPDKLVRRLVAMVRTVRNRKTMFYF
jgi:hypothetical protein